MSEERRWDQRRFHLEESTSLNGGKRTVFIEYMTPGTAVPPHWHNRFSETFDLISGSMTVYSTTQPDVDVLERATRQVKIGELQTVEPGVYHKYQVGDEPTVLRAILTPGDADFERLLMIMNGLAEDGELEEMGDSVLLMSVVMGLADAHLIGPPAVMLEAVEKEKAEEIRALRQRLLAKYDNEEQLKRLLQK